MEYNFGLLEEKRLAMMNETEKMMKKGYSFYPFFGFVLVNKAKKIRTEFMKKMKPSIIRYIVSKNYPDAIYDPKGNVRIHEVTRFGFTDIPSHFRVEDQIEGRMKGVNFNAFDCEITKIEKRQMQSNKMEYFVIEKEYTIFKGRYYIFTFNRHLTGKIHVKQKTIANEVFDYDKYYVKMETESIAFNKTFDAYATDKDYFFYMLTPVIIEKMTLLERVHKGTIHFAFQDNSFCIAVNDYKDYLEPNVLHPITQEGCQGLIDQVEIIGQMITEFGLDGLKFREKEGL